MEPEIVELGALTAVGVEYVGMDEHGEIRALWEIFTPRGPEIPHTRQPLVAVGLCRMCADGNLAYLAGYLVEKVEAIPDGMTVWEVAPSTCARFVHRGPLFGVEHDLQTTYTAIFRDWLPASGYRHAGTPNIEWYDTRFVLGSTESELVIYVPVTKKA